MMMRIATASSMVALSAACFPQCGDSCEILSPPGHGAVTQLEALSQQCTTGGEVIFSVDYNPCTHNLEYVVNTPSRCEQRQGNVFTCLKDQRCRVTPILTELKHCDCSKCENHQCAWDQQCTLQEVQCVQAPCEKQPTCVARPCDLGCPAGEVCQLQQVQCFAPPCDPIQTCVAASSSSRLSSLLSTTAGQCPEDAKVCPDGHTVVVRDPANNCEFFPCPVDACNGECAFDEVCKLQEVQCIQAPCDPIPVCEPKPCTRACAAGEKCEHVVHPCLVAPCPVSETCTLVDPCNGACSATELCYMKDVVCFAPPCDPVPTCVENRCAAVRCPQGTNCLLAENGASAVCKPWADIRCEDKPCAAGYTCTDVTRTCAAAPCYQFDCTL
eukprot:TRINITY_DN7_c1_g1_i12.p1 TRINITY_DN7_c1_g1~~TRINITY_DN7_c1_g1_i12.p1  ORF type:complete len:384 (+),score=58.87 TRINITY_DN7_c1_g1_i12:167-1318(+)